jgi:hypothetical protein
MASLGVAFSPDMRVTEAVVAGRSGVIRDEVSGVVS